MNNATKALGSAEGEQSTTSPIYASTNDVGEPWTLPG